MVAHAEGAGRLQKSIHRALFRRLFTVLYFSVRSWRLNEHFALRAANLDECHIWIRAIAHEFFSVYPLLGTR